VTPQAQNSLLHFTSKISRWASHKGLWTEKAHTSSESSQTTDSLCRGAHSSRHVPQCFATGAGWGLTLFCNGSRSRLV